MVEVEVGEQSTHKLTKEVPHTLNASVGIAFEPFAYLYLDGEIVRANSTDMVSAVEARGCLDLVDGVSELRCKCFVSEDNDVVDFRLERLPYRIYGSEPFRLPVRCVR